jgi:sulfane dehydrogenase subunit SoxC
VPPNVPEWMKAPGDPMGSQPYGTPSPFEKNVVKNISKSLPQSLGVGAHTPVESRRHHHAERVVLRASSWRRSDH